MQFSEEDLQKVAHLARLSFPKGDLDKIHGDLTNIIELVGQINSANTDGVMPMAHPIPEMTQRLRVDTVTEKDNREAYQAIAPSTDAGLYLVPKVIDNE